MTNIAVLDDDINFLNVIEKKLLNLDNDFKVRCFTNPYDLIDSIDDFKYLLLDIDLPQIDGITLSKKLRNLKISIFFITSYKELMIKAFGKNVEGFILKDDIDRGLEYFFEFVVLQKESKSIEVHTKYNHTKLFLDDILYINYSLRDIEYHLTNNNKILQKNKNLKDIMMSLDENFFLINRSVIINLKHVHDFKNGVVFLKKNHFKVSRRKQKSLMIKLFEKEISDEH